MNAPITAEALLAKLKALPPERLGQIADWPIRSSPSALSPTAIRSIGASAVSWRSQI
jgi:hypothetical protein